MPDGRSQTGSSGGSESGLCAGFNNSAAECRRRSEQVSVEEAKLVEALTVKSCGCGAVLSVGGASLAIPGQRQRLTLLGLEERVGQRDGVHSGHPRVLIELGVDVEEDGHVDLLVRVQPLLLEAETLRRDHREVTEDGGAAGRDSRPARLPGSC